MEISCKFKAEDKVYFLYDGRLTEGKVLNVCKIENPLSAAQAIYYFINSGNNYYQGINENVLYSSIEEAKQSIFSNFKI